MSVIYANVQCKYKAMPPPHYYRVEAFDYILGDASEHFSFPLPKAPSRFHHAHTRAQQMPQ